MLQVLESGMLIAWCWQGGGQLHNLLYLESHSKLTHTGYELGAWSWLVVSFREFLKTLGSGSQLEEIGHWETGDKS